MLKTLLKKQMAEIFRNYFYDPKKNKMRSRGATAMYIALYVLLMAGLLGGMFALLAVGICAPMAAAGVGCHLLAKRKFNKLALSGACSARIRACTCPRITTCCCRCRSRCAM